MGGNEGGGGRIRDMMVWGTWEELLLACAVKKHGTSNWELVANEIQNKNTNTIVTPHNCKQKYHDLHQRFMIVDDDDSEITDGRRHNNNHNDNDDENLYSNNNNNRIPWLDELRKLRVAELRREVQEYDVSILSLQLKVRRLEEEREESLKKDNNINNLDVKPDLLENRAKEEEEDGKQIQTEPLRSPIENKADKPVPGDESDRDNQSFNESNSSDLKDVKKKSPEVEKIPETVTEKQDRLGEDSCNGSSETIAKDSVVRDVKKSSETTIPVTETREPTELWESVAESKSGGNGGEEGTKESSDVQSSASLSKRNRRRKITSGSSSGEERETDEVSPAIKRSSVKSEEEPPLLGFLDMILSHKFGSLFESRLESQETSEYKGLIRQHIDIKTIRTRLKEGSYNGSCSWKFFRDLLLLFNNAIVFYPKNSSESVAATELRDLVLKGISSRSSRSSSSRSQNNNPSPREPTAPKLQQSTLLLPKSDPELSDSFLPKSKPTGLIFACRKRSSISAKAGNSAKPVEFKGSDQKIVEEKPVLDKKLKENASAVEEQIVFSKRKGQRSVSGARSSASNFKNRNNNNTDRNSSKGGSGFGGDETNLETKKEKDKKNDSNNASTALTDTVAKKKSAANFLNRMKTTSTSSNNVKLLETLKNSSSGNNSNTTRGEKGGSSKDEKHRGKGSGSGSKKDDQVTRQGDQVTRQGSSKRQRAQESSPVKRSVGRPPKKAPLLPPPSSSKRTREREKEAEAEVRQPRKRTRR
ncbi:hypothetical protein C5167_000494 [Papaver somniferum]|uniref:Bromo domain-containing protein n=1 Tax=Papaver somniferum TaxID=3469 RepID=A0A4Y7KWR5_PAPSO|nr:general transcriptional corepressor trfA-like [Papaver somniferum]RZC76399.1 hypothetical protein C5167_000494 [Papaver somniferum]